MNYALHCRRHHLIITMTYREPLPDGCPPDKAEEIESPWVVYRLVRNSPPTGGDFRSQRAEQPTVHFNVCECRACGVSVFTNRLDAENQRRRRKLKSRVVCRVTLTPGAGRIKKTGGTSHHTWWPYYDYDILTTCQLVN